jgi:hypothetical protein
MSLAIRGEHGISADDVKRVKVGTWIAERLQAATYQGPRTEEIAFGRPRKVIAVMFRGTTRRKHVYVNCLVAFGPEKAAITLVQGQSRFRIAAKPDVFTLAKFSKSAEHSIEIADL